MVDARDPGTLQLPLSFKRSRGRPRKDAALTGAQRQARFRVRRQAATLAFRERALRALSHLERGEVDMARRELELLATVTSQK